MWHLSHQPVKVECIHLALLRRTYTSALRKYRQLKDRHTLGYAEGVDWQPFSQQTLKLSLRASRSVLEHVQLQHMD
jgi:hypothetical protein